MPLPTKIAIASASSSPVAAGAFADDEGVLVASGYLVITPNFKSGTLTGGGIVSNTAVRITLDANGVPTAGQAIYSSDQFLSPVSPSFSVVVKNSSDSIVADLGNCVLSGSAPIDLTLLTAVSAVASFPSPGPTSTVVAFSATPTFALPGTLTSSSLFAITLTGNVTSSTLSGGNAGQIITFKLIQDSTGGRTFVWPANVKNAQSPDTTANSISVQSFSFDGANAYPLGPMTVN